MLQPRTRRNTGRQPVSSLARLHKVISRQKSFVRRYPDTRPWTGKVYFFYWPGTGMLKVGWTGRHLDERRRDLEAQEGARCKVLGMVYGSQVVERWLQRTLKPRLARGKEWFRASPAEADLIALWLS